jgi:pyruvate formate lyase activating enzyme
VLDCARLVREKGLKNVIVTNGFICEDILRKLLPYIDAMNIDLKGFTPEFHKEIFSDLETVKNTIEISNEACHVEVTTLVIPGVNDSENEIKEIAKWLSTVNQNIPYHISRFSPYFEYIHVPATDVNKIYSLVEVARRYLTYVYPGNC